MFRRLATVSATTVVAARAQHSAAVGEYGYMIPKVDFHKDVQTKFVAKAAFNPYSAGFMEDLEKRSLAAANYTSNVDNQFQTLQHTSSLIMTDNVFNK